jgi:hypothetical protein
LSGPVRNSRVPCGFESRAFRAREYLDEGTPEGT